jgi:enoyl-CoA hydratase/carnithine racemase
MPQSCVRIHLHEHVATVMLNRPERRNAISRQLMAELSQAFDDLHLQRSARAVILTGSGSAFCAGMDLEEMRTTASSPDPHTQWHEDTAQYQALLEQMLLFPKPIVAAVNGPAVAGGAGLVLACDVVVAADTATFGLPEPLRGLTAGVVSPLLTFRIGGGYASYLLMTARTINAAEAHRIGLFQEVVPADHLWPRAVELGAQCARCAPESLQMTKRMLNETIGESLTTLLSLGAAVSATARTTEAAAEGIAAFLEKRAARWP